MTIGRHSKALLRAMRATLIMTAFACGSGGDSGPSAPTNTGPAPAATVSINPGSLSLFVGTTQTLSATVKDAAGNTLAGRTVSWLSSSPAIASVSSTGDVTGAGAGNATITATSEGRVGSAAVTVTATVAAVSLTLNYGSVMAGQSADAQVVPRDAAGNALTNRTISLSSSDPAIASVTPDGFISTKAAGSVTISATVDGKTGSAPFVVLPPPAADANLHVEFSPVVYPSSGGKGLSVILDGRAGTSAAAIDVNGVSRPLQRVSQSNRYVVTLTDAELASRCSTATGSLPGCGIGNITVTTDGTSQTVFGVVARSPANVPAVTVTTLGPTAQRSDYTVNLRQDDFDATSAAKQFYGRGLPDTFDYLVLHNTAFIPNGSVFFISARNNVPGLGMSNYDLSATYGASPTGKLRGFVNYTTNAPIDLAQQVLTHEMGHAFCCFITGTPLSGGRPHWPLSTAAFGIMGGNGSPGSNAGDRKLTPLGNGTYRVDAQTPYGGFTNLDLYLFGLADSSEVEPQFVFTNQTQSTAIGAVLSGATTTTTIRDIVIANGLRPLEYTGTPITYHAALVVVSRGRLLTPQEMAYFDLAAQRGEARSTFDGGFLTPFYVNTRGRAILVTKLP